MKTLPYEPEFSIGARIRIGEQQMATVTGWFVTAREIMYECTFIHDGERRMITCHALEIELAGKHKQSRAGFGQKKEEK